MGEVGGPMELVIGDEAEDLGALPLTSGRHAGPVVGEGRRGVHTSIVVAAAGPGLSVRLSGLSPPADQLPPAAART